MRSAAVTRDLDRRIGEAGRYAKPGRYPGIECHCPAAWLYSGNIQVMKNSGDAARCLFRARFNAPEMVFHSRGGDYRFEPGRLWRLANHGTKLGRISAAADRQTLHGPSWLISKRL